MRKSQAGIGVVGAALLLVVVGIISTAGWVVYKQQDATKSDTAKQSQQAVRMIDAADSTKTFSYSYPSNWSLQKYIWSPCCEGEARPEPDWTTQTQPITLKEKSLPLTAAIQIDDFGPDAIEREYSSRTLDAFNTYTKLKINGYDALYHVTDFVGPSEAEKYKDHEYIISTGNKSVRLQFRERYSNSTINGESDFNASAVLSDFEKVVRSVGLID